MAFDTNLWNNTKAGEYAEKEDPPLGQHVVTIAEAKFTQTGELKDKPTIVVQYRTQDGKQWDDVKQLTSEGRIKSAKILMSSLGLNPEAVSTPDQIHAALKSLEGKYFAVEVKQSTAIRPDGRPYLNTNVIGPWSGQPTTFTSSSDVTPPDASSQPYVQTPAAAVSTPEGW